MFEWHGRAQHGDASPEKDVVGLTAVRGPASALVQTV
jgi:hypothetical protein